MLTLQSANLDNMGKMSFLVRDLISLSALVLECSCLKGMTVYFTLHELSKTLKDCEDISEMQVEYDQKY